MTVYLELTRQFNEGRLRAIISGDAHRYFVEQAEALLPTAIERP